jgi:hypothetical protein
MPKKFIDVGMGRGELLAAKRELIRELRFTIRQLQRLQDDAEFIAINTVENSRAGELYAYAEACENATDGLKNALKYKGRQ